MGMSPNLSPDRARRGTPYSPHDHTNTNHSAQPPVPADTSAGSGVVGEDDGAESGLDRFQVSCHFAAVRALDQVELDRLIVGQAGHARLLHR
mgnify:CR=1 FL=1